MPVFFVLSAIPLQKKGKRKFSVNLTTDVFMQHAVLYDTT